ncbi:MAG: sigma-70 family RNA polymerase sigma factor [Calditrichaeota bacterium]|nr:sigma-70 family RNA polymerase sigma factor [Calditrichota bacterium]MCB0315016.1 sigma-70 family RNA polymerase sigma factor [Calditrichota bacterium]
MHQEQERIEKIIAGDMRAFQALVEDYQRLVCHVVFRMVHNEEDREEICQDVFVKVYQNLSKFEQKSKLSTWIGRIAYNTCINYLKKKKVPLYEDLAPAESGESGSSQNKGSYLDRVPGGAKLADETVSDKEMYKFLHEEIAQLPVQYRAILTLYHMDDLSYQEIGEIMSLPDGTVKSYLFRARKLLKERIIEKYPAEELW